MPRSQGDQEPRKGAAPGTGARATAPAVAAPPAGHLEVPVVQEPTGAAGGAMVQSGGGGWTVVPGRRPRAKAKVPAGGGPEAGVGVGGRGAVGRGAGGSGGTAGAGGQAVNRPPGGGALPADGGQGGRRGGQGRAFLPRASLEVRENTACLHMEGFQVLPTEEEFVQWLEDEVFKDELGIMSLVLEGFQFLSIDTYCKKMLMTLSTETQL